MLQSIKSFLSKGNRAQRCIFFIFVLTLLVKNLLFHWYFFHSIVVSSLWYAPLHFVRFWGAKLTPALFIASFVFLSKRTWWTIIALLLSDIWIIANLFYYKVNTLFLTVETIKLVGNMNGFWDSLFSLIGWDIVSFLIVTVLYICVYLPFAHLSATSTHTHRRRGLCLTLVGIVLSLCMAALTNHCYYLAAREWMGEDELDGISVVNKLRLYAPFGNVHHRTMFRPHYSSDVWSALYIREYSIIGYFPATFLHYYSCLPTKEILCLTADDEQRVNPLFSTQENKPTATQNLIFILVESLESWPLADICGTQYMPNISNMLNNEHVLYCDKVTSQVKYGTSADGQLINVTGLLPISSGVTCFSYSDNNYPSYADCYQRAAIINPSPKTWNKDKVTWRYHFNELIEPNDCDIWGNKIGMWSDQEILDKTIAYADTCSAPFCVLTLTVSSHLPFSYGENHPTYSINGMPTQMNAYLNCLYYTDSCINTLITFVQENDRLRDNTTIVITGDHTIFRTGNKDFDQFAQANNINMRIGHSFTPLIIYSPNIKGNVQIADTCYQMDVYPTIMPLIGCEDYYWKGLGVNLLDSTARYHRPLTEQEAYQLSDKLIRSKYFDRYSTLE